MKKFILPLLVILVFLTAQAAAEAPQYAQTNCDANIREDASTRADIDFVLELGTRVLIEDTLDAEGRVWCWISVDGAPQRKGYVMRELLDLEPQSQDVVTTQASQESSAVVATGNSVQVDLAYYLAAVSQAEPDLTERFSPETLAAYTALSEGDRGEEVLALKERLYELGYYAKQQTGPLYTESTAEIVARFQSINGLPDDGVATPLTQAVIYADEALTPDAEPEDQRPILIRSGRIVRYEGSSAVQIQLYNDSRDTLTGFTLQIIPYSTYGEPVAVEPSLAGAAAHTWSCAGILVNHAGKYDCVAKKEYFVVSQGNFYTGALVSVVSYTTQDGTVVAVDPADRDWYSIGTADAAHIERPARVPVSDAERARAQAWSLGFSSEYVTPAWRALYGAPQGLVITRIDDYSYAAVAGLQPGDVALALNGTALTGSDALTKAQAAIAQGDSFELLYWRDGVYFSSTLTR